MWNFFYNYFSSLALVTFVSFCLSRCCKYAAIKYTKWIWCSGKFQTPLYHQQWKRKRKYSTPSFSRRFENSWDIVLKISELKRFLVNNSNSYSTPHKDWKMKTKTKTTMTAHLSFPRKILIKKGIFWISWDMAKITKA